MKAPALTLSERSESKGFSSILVLVSLACLLLAGVATAHTYPSRRSIAVQAEKDALVVLALWTAPAGEAGDLFDLGAAMSAKGGNKARAALEAQLAAKAIGPLTLTLDGKPLEPSSVRTRLIEDPPRSGRRAVAVLVEAPSPAGAHNVAVTLGPTGETTRMNFVDRSIGAARATGRVPEGGLVPPGTSFSITWSETR